MSGDVVESTAPEGEQAMPRELRAAGAGEAEGAKGADDDRARRGRVFTPQFVLSVPFLLMIRGYQLVLGPVMGGHCRFHPTCSEYGLEAYRRHGPIRGTWLTVWRIARCHPFGGSGFDPVPEE